FGERVPASSSGSPERLLPGLPTALVDGPGCMAWRPPAQKAVATSMLGGVQTPYFLRCRLTVSGRKSLVPLHSRHMHVLSFLPCPSYRGRPAAFSCTECGSIVDVEEKELRCGRWTGLKQRLCA